MSPVSGITQAGQSLQSAWNKIGQKVEELSTQVADGGVGDTAYLQTVVELKNLQLQAKVAGAIFETLDELAASLLTQPRK